MVIKFIKKLIGVKELTTAQKKAEIRGAIIKFYEDLDKTTGSVEIPAFMRADETIKKKIKTDEDIERFYQMLLKYGWFNRCTR